MDKSVFPSYSVVSVLAQWVVLGIIIANTNIWELKSWFNGLVISVILAMPNALLQLEKDRKSVPIIITISAMLVSLVGFVTFRIGL